jgi:hypothetical protein
MNTNPEYQITPELLREKLDNFAGVKLNKVTATRLFKIRELLNTGEDPFMVALFFRVPFDRVARIANNVLEERGIAGRIPETLLGYLALVDEITAGKAVVVDGAVATVPEALRALQDKSESELREIVFPSESPPMTEAEIAAFTTEATERGIGAIQTAELVPDGNGGSTLVVGNDTPQTSAQ